MRKHILLTGFVALCSGFIATRGVFAQTVGISSNPSFLVNPRASLHLDGSSGTKGVLLPRMTAGEITVFTASLLVGDEGMTVYNTDTDAYQVWDGSAWQTLLTSGSAGVTLDQAYDFGGAGAGRTITADAGAVTIAGTDGLVSTGTTGSGAVAPSGAGTRMVWNPRKAAFRVGEVSGTQWNDANIGVNSTAIGLNTTASGLQSFAVGSGAGATNTNAMAIGASSVASGSNSHAFGSSVTASGSFASAFGRLSTASGNISTTLGLSNTASGLISLAAGNSNTAPSYGETVFGIGATTYTPNSATAFGVAQATDRLFVVGNAIDANSNTVIDAGERSDALVILKNGNTGIGSSTPQDRLHVVGNIRMVDGNQAAGKVLTSDANGTATWQAPAAPVETDPQVSSSGANAVPRWNGTTLVDGTIINSGSNVGINNASPNNALDVVGDAFFRSNFMDNGLKVSTTIGSGAWADLIGTDLSGNSGGLMMRPATIVSNQYLYMSSTGKFGMGTQNPTNIFDVVGGMSIGSNVFPSAAPANGLLVEGSVGVGTTAPAEKLHVVGSIRMVDGNEAAGKVLTSDANGTATWQTAASGGVTLDGAYDFGGAGTGRTITADAGAVTIDGTDGLVSTGTSGSGAVAPSGAGTRMVWNPRKAAFRAGTASTTGWDDANIGLRSFAAGQSTIASGAQSAAFGNGATASGTTSMAMGSSTTASGNTSIAMGTSTTANGTSSTAMGNFTSAFGTSSTAMGSNTSASGNVSTAMGSSTTASGGGSTAMGASTTASGNTSTAMGSFSTASGNVSTAMGLSNTAPSFGETVLGIGANTYTPSTNGATQFRTANATDRLLVVGNAIDANNNGLVDAMERSDALVILKNGNTGISISNPQERLHVAGRIRMADGNQGLGKVMTSDATGTATWQDPAAPGTTLDGAYDFGGAGAGRTITADAGAVTIDGTDGLVSTGTLGSGATAPSGSGTRMVWNPRKQAFRAGTVSGTQWNDGSIGQSSIAFGSSTIASGTTSFAMGNGTTASGAVSTAFGDATSATGTASMAVGFATTASGVRSFAMGSETVASGRASMASGHQGTAPSFGETVLGIGATTYTPSTNGATQFRTANATDRLLVVGNAIDANNNDNVDAGERSDALVILKNGNTGIGSSTPQDRLHVVGNIRMVDGNQAAGKVLTSDANGTATWQDPAAPGTTLDGAYDFGGAGAGSTITADAGAVTIDGTDGFVSTGTSGSGAVAPSGAGTRLVWSPRKAAIRAGSVNGTQWNDASIGSNSASFGENNTSSGFASMTWGNASTASGSLSTAGGSGATASGSFSRALGYQATASGDYSTAMGAVVAAPSYSETAIGVFNTNYTPSSATAFNATDRLLVVGNGTGSGSRSDALVILKNGNTGIGSSTPQSRLHVVGNIRMVDGNQAAGKVLTSDANGTATWQDAATVSGVTLDQAYDQGGAGAGRTISADAGAVLIQGADGFQVTGTHGSGATLDLSGAGTRMFFHPRKSAFRAGGVSTGQWNDASVGVYSVAIGQNVTASGASSVAFGLGCSATANETFAAGFSSSATAQYAVALGRQCAASNTAAIAIGSSVTATGSGAMGFGSNLTVTANNSMSFGGQNSTDGNRSQAFGNFNTASSFGETVLGIGATTYTPSVNGDTQFRTANATDRLLVVGNAIDANNNNTVDAGERSDALVILKNGNTGIGVSAPTTKLQLSSPSNATKTVLTQDVTSSGLLITTDYSAANFTPGLFWNTSNNNATKPKAGIFLQETGSGTSMFFGTSSNYSTGITNDALVINHLGNVGINSTAPAERLEVKGKALFTDGFSSTNAALMYKNTTDYMYLGPQSGSSLQGASLALFGSANNVSSNPNGINMNSPQGGRINMGFTNATFVFNANSTSNYTSTLELNDTGLDIGHNSNSRAIRFLNGGGERVRIAENGRVGIGTTAPTEALSVGGAVTVTNGGETFTTGGAITSSNFRVKRDLASYNTTNSSANPVHIKTNIPYQSSIMYRFLVEGYNYGVPQPINCEAVGYTYSGSVTIFNEVNVNHSSGAAITQYYSSDGFVTLRLSAASFYYAGFAVSAWMTNPAGAGFDVKVTAITQQAANL